MAPSELASSELTPPDIGAVVTPNTQPQRDPRAWRLNANKPEALEATGGFVLTGSVVWTALAMLSTRAQG